MEALEKYQHWSEKRYGYSANINANIGEVGPIIFLVMSRIAQVILTFLIHLNEQEIRKRRREREQIIDSYISALSKRHSLQMHRGCYHFEQHCLLYLNLNDRYI